MRFTAYIDIENVPEQSCSPKFLSEFIKISLESAYARSAAARSGKGPCVDVRVEESLQNCLLSL